MAKKNTNEKEGRSDHAIRLHQDRLKSLRKAQEFSQADDIIHAVEYYRKYLQTLAIYYNIEEKRLHPKYFDNKKEMAELLLVSHVYWDLAKAYDRSPNLRHESIRCLDQFAKFTIGFKFQYVNAQMLNNFIKKKKAYNIKVFKDTYSKIRVQAKSCYIATYCYGETHSNTLALRDLKENLIKNKYGRKFVLLYYQFSPSLVRFSYSNPKIGNFLKKYVFKPIIKLILNK